MYFVQPLNKTVKSSFGVPLNWEFFTLKWEIVKTVKIHKNGEIK